MGGYDPNRLPDRRPLSAQIDLWKFAPAPPPEEPSPAGEERRPRRAARRLLKNRAAMLGLILLAALALMAAVVPAVYPYGYSEIITIDGVRDRTARNLAPFQHSKNEQAAIAAGQRIFPHLFGTDELCRDYFIRVVCGMRVSLLSGLFAAAAVLAVGVPYGAVAGYFGGKVDLAMMRVADAVYSLPDLLMVVLLSVVLDQALGDFIAETPLGALGTNLTGLFIAFGLFYWAGMARLVRGRVMSIRESDYVLAARGMGAKSGRILRRHLLPNCASVVLAAAAMQIPTAIFAESFLSFVGLGVQAPMPSLGSLANAARGGMQSHPHKLIFPAAGICLIVLAFNLLADGLRDALDPAVGR